MSKMNNDYIIELINMPLYTELSLASFEIRTFSSFPEDTQIIDTEYRYKKNFKNYCIKCKSEETFKFEHVLDIEDIPGTPFSHSFILIDDFEAKKYFNIKTKCLMCNEENIYYFRLIKKDEEYIFIKIGEFPSAYKKKKINRKVEKYLPDEAENLRIAITLQSYGYIKGASVYLRSIYEKVINDLNDEDEQEFLKLKMDEKLKK